MRSVDTNVLVRFLTRDDEHQFQLAEAALRGGDVWISKTVLLETEWVLRSRYSYRPHVVRDALELLLGLPGISIENPEAVSEAFDLFDKGLDFADALQLASRPEAAHFITFDDALVRRAKKAGVKKVSSAAH
jgi:predicted nucleic-acid-binding protein